MARHLNSGNPRARRVRFLVLLGVWLVGLLVGFYGILASVRRYSCGSARGLVCTSAGTTASVLIIIAVIAVVTAVTVVTHGREPRSIAVAGACGLVGLGLCFLAAQGLLSAT